MARNLPTAIKNDDSPKNEREHFIPIRQSELVACLSQQLSGSERQKFIQLSRIVSATFHYEFHLRMERLKDAYADFDPDRDTATVSSDDVSTSKGPDPESFFDATMELLERANFNRLDRSDVEATIGAASGWGVNLHVDFDLFERLEVYARGDVVGTKIRRRLRNRYRDESVEVPMYQRLVVVFQLREGNRLTHGIDSNRLYLKLFKNIPKMDLDMLLPGTRVKITRFDQSKIILPTLSGIVMALIKIIKGVALLATATVTGVLSFLGLLGGTIGYGVKSFLGYMRTKDKYQLNLTRSLYFQNLDNNSGVLFRLLDEAEEQEVREALLAWFLLWQQAPEEGWTNEEIDIAAEDFLEQHFGVRVDFEIDDAMAKLDRLGLSQKNQHGKWTATSITRSLAELDRAWDDLFQFQDCDQESNRRVA